MTSSTSRGTSLETALIILEILRLLPRRRFTTATHVWNALTATGYERDMRSVQRLLEQLCDHFPIERDTRGKPYGYRWAENAHGFRLAGLTPPEALLLQIARSHISDFLPAHIARQLDTLFDAAQKTIDERPSASVERRWLKKIRRIPNSQPLLPPRLKPGIFEVVSEALYYEQKLNVHYVNAQGKRREAVIAPLGLALQEPRLYLVCRFDGYDNERILSLARIDKARLVNESFVYPKEFDLTRYDGEGRFAFGVGQQVRLAFRIDKSVGRHLTESPLALDQQVVEDDTCLAITATVTDSMLLRAWLRGLGDAIEEVAITPC